MGLSDSERKFMESGRAAGYSDGELVAKVKERRNSAPSYKLTDYAGENKAGPYSQAQQTADVKLSRDPLAEGDADVRDPRWQRLTGHTPEDEAERERQSEARGFMGFAAGGLAGMAAGGAARALGAGPGIQSIASGAATGALPSALAGDEPLDIAKNAAVAAAIPAGGTLLKGVGNRIRGSEGGQARALWEKHGGNVGPLDSGSGVDEIAGLEPSRANVGKASAIGARNIRRGMDESFDAEVSKPFVEAKNAVDYSPTSKEWTDVSSLMQTIGEVPQALRPAIRKEIQDLGAVMTDDGRVMMTHADLNTARQKLSSIANYGLASGPGTANIKDQSFKSVANAAKVLVDEGPYAQANDIYERGMNMRAADRADIGLRKSPAKLEAGRATEDAKVAQILRNRGNDSEAAGAMAERADVPGFVSRHPELERQVDLPDLVRAKGKLEFGLDGGKTHNLIQASEHPTALKKYLDLLGHNADAVNGRLLYAPAGGAQAIGGAAQSAEMNQIIAALAAQRERERQRAEALGR